MATATTEALAEFIVHTDYGHIPREAVSVAKSAILDCLGVSIAGALEAGPKIMVELAKESGAIGESRIMCNNFRTSAETAAWLNGTAAHVLDYDDTFPISVGWNFHPTVSILPAALALGEKLRKSGKEVLVAYIIGIEVESKVGSSIGKYNSDAGWHTLPIIGTIGAVAASAKIIGLNTTQTQMALGIGGALAGGLRLNFGTMAKSFQAGNAARNGVLASLLAGKGFTANENILDGQIGFCSLFSGAKATHLKDDQNTWSILSPGLAFKSYPSCRATHASIDAALHLRTQLDTTRTDEIEEVICEISPRSAQFAKFHRPQTGYEGKFSVEFCVATALLQGKVTLEAFSPEKVHDSKVEKLLRKIKVLPREGTVDGPFDLTADLCVKLRGGREYSHRVSLPKGEPPNPMGQKELLAKFKECASLCMPEEQIEETIGIIADLDTVENISILMEKVAF